MVLRGIFAARKSGQQAHKLIAAQVCALTFAFVAPMASGALAANPSFAEPHVVANSVAGEHNLAAEKTSKLIRLAQSGYDDDFDPREALGLDDLTDGDDDDRPVRNDDDDDFDPRDALGLNDLTDSDDY